MKRKYYRTDTITFKLKNATTVLIEAKNDFDVIVKVAQFDFRDNGYKFYYDLNGNQKDVKRISTIINYLLENGMTWWSQKEINIAKENAKKMKEKEEKKYKLELRERDEQKAKEVIEGIKKENDKYINMCESLKNKDDDILYQLVKNTFKHAKKRVINEVFNTIKEYNSSIA